LIELKGVYDFLFATASEELFAIGSEAKPIECLLHLASVDDRRSFEIDSDDFVLAIAGMENRQPTAAGMKSDVDRKNAEIELLACGAKRPLVGQENRAAGPHAGENTGRLVGDGVAEPIEERGRHGKYHEGRLNRGLQS
jgi:hypothetical protein